MGHVNFDNQISKIFGGPKYVLEYSASFLKSANGWTKIKKVIYEEN